MSLEKELFISNILNLNRTIAEEIFKRVNYPWEVLPILSDFIIELISRLMSSKYEKLEENILVAKNARISKTAELNGPLIIDEGAEIRHCAFIRGNAIIGKNAVVGNSTEIKNSILFDNVQVPHYNYVGDSILGYKSHLGAGCIISNVKADKKNVCILCQGEKINTGLRKFGAIVGDEAEVGCNSVLNPGTIIGRQSRIYPLSSVRGVIEDNSIYKSKDNIVKIK